MEIDARKLSKGATLEADLCVVGAGPAGMALAHELSGERIRLLVLESGGWNPEDPIQELSEGETVGDPYAGLRATRCRAVGGTAHVWNTPVGGAQGGAKYAPLDAWDFSPHEERPLSGWPFGEEDVRPYYVRAQVLCGLGPFAYDAGDWSDDARPSFALDDERLTTRVYQFGSGEIFTRDLPRALASSDTVTVCHHATVCGLERTSERALEALTCSSTTDLRFRVRAKVFVFAAGAVKNARLLLLSGDGAEALGNRHGFVGRCFMEHVRDYALILVPRSGDLFERASFYDAHPAGGGTMVCGRIALTEKGAVRGGWPNASITLFPRHRIRPGFSSSSGWMVRRIRRIAGWKDRRGYGWSSDEKLARQCDSFQLVVNVEQRPHPENRILLASGRDRFGVPRAVLHWRWRPEEQAQLERLHGVLAAGLEAAHLGRVDVRDGVRPDPDSHHHAGTTRMHIDPRYGVVDADGRVHDTDNLFVTGSSIFPTAGFANPTLTIVALSIRLADHLKRRI